MIRQRLNTISKALRKIGFFVPVTWYFSGFVLAALIAWNWLGSKDMQPGTAYADIFSLLLKVALAFVVIAVTMALLPVLVSWIYFFIHKRNGRARLTVKTEAEEKDLSQAQEVYIRLSPVLRPLLGFTRIRLQYDTHHYSDKFSLVRQSNTGVFSPVIEGVYHWPLPEIKEYHVQGAIIYFEDFFQFFSLAVQVKTANRFFIRPSEKELEPVRAFPRKTEDTTTRIEEIRRVEGEHINYKHFEANDDVRRIVWKIYAKNKELVVRVPEIMDPYASHVYLYASFHSVFDTNGNRVVEKPFLNHYKSVVWTIYRQLLEQGLEVRYVPDQRRPEQHFTNNRQEVKYAISTAGWQRERDLEAYVRSSETAVLVVSSLTDAEKLASLAEAQGHAMIIILVKLSDSLSRQHFANWVEWVFVQQEKNEIEVYKTSWSLSPLRPLIRQNENRIEALLNKFEKPVII